MKRGTRAVRIKLMDPFDSKVRYHIYSHFVDKGEPPSVETVAIALNEDIESVRKSFHNLAIAHAILLDPGSEQIRMANPLSGIPTTFGVETESQSYFANSAWDALGIPAMLSVDANIEALCGDCGERILLSIVSGEVRGPEVLTHFALPFKHWYDDIIHT